ncbi:telomeric repeat-binding factor [Anaeramoeba flamelloides]|uniref:Telomeric repeat-binding factor n=1 Tax=Anaeramoeba flamelloides TaxID=1746091 RepID=A0AAV7YIN8_9EUKA|nr:telomeric repeat-binding factor [Anaeramoeba flamelloides]
MNSTHTYPKSERINNLLIELHPYFSQRTQKEQEACLSLMSLGFQQQQQQQQQQPTLIFSPPSSPINFHNTEDFLNEDTFEGQSTVIRKRLHLEMGSESSETSGSETESFENELKRKTRTIQRTNPKKKTFKRTSRNKTVHQKRIILKCRNKKKSTITTSQRKKTNSKRSRRHETRPKAFARLRVFWSNEECCCLIDGINRFGVGKWSKIMGQAGYNFHLKRTPHDLKDKWRNLTKFHNMENLQIKYKYQQWLKQKQLNQQLN